MSKDENPQSNISGKIDSGGGMINSGSINTNGGDVIGRDKIVYGDEVQGDKIVNITRLDLSDTRSQRNHAALREAVRIFWIDGVDDVGVCSRIRSITNYSFASTWNSSPMR